MTIDQFTVDVRPYRRIRGGCLELVRRHKRRPRRWFKRPKHPASYKA